MKKPEFSESAEIEAVKPEGLGSVGDAFKAAELQKAREEEGKNFDEESLTFPEEKKKKPRKPKSAEDFSEGEKKLSKKEQAAQRAEADRLRRKQEAEASEASEVLEKKLPEAENEIEQIILEIESFSTDSYDDLGTFLGNKYVRLAGVCREVKKIANKARDTDVFSLYSEKEEDFKESALYVLRMIESEVAPVKVKEGEEAPESMSPKAILDLAKKDLHNIVPVRSKVDEVAEQASDAEEKKEVEPKKPEKTEKKEKPEKPKVPKAPRAAAEALPKVDPASSPKLEEFLARVRNGGIRRKQEPAGDQGTIVRTLRGAKAAEQMVKAALAEFTSPEFKADFPSLPARKRAVEMEVKKIGTEPHFIEDFLAVAEEAGVFKAEIIPDFGSMSTLKEIEQKLINMDPLTQFRVPKGSSSEKYPGDVMTPQQVAELIEFETEQLGSEWFKESDADVKTSYAKSVIDALPAEGGLRDKIIKIWEGRKLFDPSIRLVTDTPVAVEPAPVDVVPADVAAEEVQPEATEITAPEAVAIETPASAEPDPEPAPERGPLNISKAVKNLKIEKKKTQKIPTKVTAKTTDTPPPIPGGAEKAEAKNDSFSVLKQNKEFAAFFNKYPDAQDVIDTHSESELRTRLEVFEAYKQVSKGSYELANGVLKRDLGLDFADKTMGLALNQEETFREYFEREALSNPSAIFALQEKVAHFKANQEALARAEEQLKTLESKEVLAERLQTTKAKHEIFSQAKKTTHGFITLGSLQSAWASIAGLLNNNHTPESIRAAADAEIAALPSDSKRAEKEAKIRSVEKARMKAYERYSEAKEVAIARHKVENLHKLKLGHASTFTGTARELGSEVDRMQQKIDRLEKDLAAVEQLEAFKKEATAEFAELRSEFFEKVPPVNVLADMARQEISRQMKTVSAVSSVSELEDLYMYSDFLDQKLDDMPPGMNVAEDVDFQGVQKEIQEAIARRMGAALFEAIRDSTVKKGSGRVVALRNAIKKSLAEGNVGDFEDQEKKKELVKRLLAESFKKFATENKIADPADKEAKKRAIVQFMVEFGLASNVKEAETAI